MTDLLLQLRTGKQLQMIISANQPASCGCFISGRRAKCGNDKRQRKAMAATMTLQALGARAPLDAVVAGTAPHFRLDFTRDVRTKELRWVLFTGTLARACE